MVDTVVALELALARNSPISKNRAQTAFSDSLSKFIRMHQDAGATAMLSNARSYALAKRVPRIVAWYPGTHEIAICSHLRVGPDWRLL